jgi:hypothetical protein
MTHDEVSEAIGQMLRRATLRKSAYGDDHITADFDAHKGDSPDKVPVQTPWGVSGLPPVGATLLVAAQGGRSDRMHVVSAELPSARPKGLPAGGMAVHDDGDNQIRLEKTSGIHAFSPGDMRFTRKIGKKIYLGGDPAQGGIFSPVLTAAGPSTVVFALRIDRDYSKPGG